MQKILYITYDGLLDPLGSSQILPYIYNIALNKNLYILSFEKNNQDISEIGKLKKHLIIMMKYI